MVRGHPHPRPPPYVVLMRSLTLRDILLMTGSFSCAYAPVGGLSPFLLRRLMRPLLPVSAMTNPIRSPVVTPFISNTPLTFQALPAFLLMKQRLFFPTPIRVCSSILVRPSRPQPPPPPLLGSSLTHIPPPSSTLSRRTVLAPSLIPSL